MKNFLSFATMLLPFLLFRVILLARTQGLFSLRIQIIYSKKMNIKYYPIMYTCGVDALSYTPPTGGGGCALYPPLATPMQPIVSMLVTIIQSCLKVVLRLLLLQKWWYMIANCCESLTEKSDVHRIHVEKKAYQHCKHWIMTFFCILGMSSSGKYFHETRAFALGQIPSPF